MKKLQISSKIVLLLLAIAFTPAIHADDKIAKEKLDVAEKLYGERDQEEKLAQGITVLEAAEKDATDKNLKFQISILHAKFLYFKGNHTKTDKEKQATLLAALEIAKKSHDYGDFAEGYFWEAACLSRWAKSVGIATSVKRRPELLKLLETANKKKLQDGSASEAYEGYGTTRILGKVLYELPAALGGDVEASAKGLEKAYKNAPEYAGNVHFYAESLYASAKKVEERDKDKEKAAEMRATAKKILDDLLAKDPLTYNPKRIPETKDEFAEAKKARATLK